MCVQTLTDSAHGPICCNSSETTLRCRPLYHKPPEPPSALPCIAVHRCPAGKYSEGRFVYEGEFVDDVVSGTGKFCYPSGSYYDGQWLSGQYHGQGKYVWPDGRSYEVTGAGWAGWARGVGGDGGYGALEVVGRWRLGGYGVVGRWVLGAPWATGAGG